MSFCLAKITTLAKKFTVSAIYLYLVFSKNAIESETNKLPRGRAHEVLKFQKKQIPNSKKKERGRASGN